MHIYEGAFHYQNAIHAPEKVHSLNTLDVDVCRC